MYKRYYDGYSTGDNLHNPGGNSIDCDYEKTDLTDIIKVDDTKVEPLSAGITNSASAEINSLLPIGLGGLQFDDIILLGLLILLLFESENSDTTLLLIIGVIFIAGLNT